jgi:hypothetical protein
MSDYGTHTYDNMTRARVDAILSDLIAHGSVVTGNNPWVVDTKKHGVLLKGEWSEETSTLAVTVTDADWYVTRRAVWENIDGLMRQARIEDERDSSS